MRNEAECRVESQFNNVDVFSYVFEDIVTFTLIVHKKVFFSVLNMF